MEMRRRPRRRESWMQELTTPATTPPCAGWRSVGRRRRCDSPTSSSPWLPARLFLYVEIEVGHGRGMLPGCVRSYGLTGFLRFETV